MGNFCTTPYQKLTPEEELLIPDSPPQSGHIDILSYNLFIRPPFINNNGDDYKDERIAEFLKKISSYDVVCLQEMFDVYSRRRQDFLKKVRELGFLFYAVAPKLSCCSRSFIDAGLVILSRYPIVVKDFCLFPLGIGIDYYVQKGVLYAQIAIGNARLHIYNTHPQANYSGTPDFLKRSAQFTICQKFIESTLKEYHYREEDLVLFVGDFNVDSRSPVKFSVDTLVITPLIVGRTNLTKQVHFTEYEALLSYLSDDHKDEIEDLLLRDLGEHPITFGNYYVTENNEKIPLEAVLTNKGSQCTKQSLDYIFRYVPKSLLEKKHFWSSSRHSSRDKLMAVKGSAKVEKFLVTGHEFDQLSDHYGVQVKLEYLKNTKAEKITEIST